MDMDVKKRKFGLLADGSKVSLYTVDNGEMSFSVTNYGCVITSICVPSKKGIVSDVVLGPATFDGLINSDIYFGACVGRFANRISGASFSIDGNQYQLDKNDGDNCLHSGFFRWDKQLWDAEIVETASGTGIRFSRMSPDGEQGMPGNMQVSVTYLLNSHNALTIHYDAVSDAVTPVNITNHSYFNLAGHNSGSIDTHILTLDCSSYLETDEYRIPTGAVLPVDNTPFDFRNPKAIGKDLHTADFSGAKGYDHCYCIDRKKGKLVQFATVFEPVSGRTMTVLSDMPGVQFYTGNWIEGISGKNGYVYHDYDGFCLETQQYPDAPNKPDFPSCLLHPGDRLSSTTVYQFKW